MIANLKFNGGSGESGDVAHRRLKRKESVANYINLNGHGDDGFTSLHFASFHGNIKLIRYLVHHGANSFAVNWQGINMIHVAA